MKRHYLDIINEEAIKLKKERETKPLSSYFPDYEPVALTKEKERENELMREHLGSDAYDEPFRDVVMEEYLDRGLHLSDFH